MYVFLSSEIAGDKAKPRYFFLETSKYAYYYSELVGYIGQSGNVTFHFWGLHEGNASYFRRTVTSSPSSLIDKHQRNHISMSNRG